MNGKLYIWGLALVLSALILSGCSSDTGEATEVVVTDDSIDVTPEGVVDAPFATARNTALAFVSGRYGEQASPSGLAWTTERTTPEEHIGSTTFQYTAEVWVVTVSCPVVPLETVVCQVKVTDQDRGFHWLGKVDAAGQVTELSGPAVEAPKGVRAAHDAVLAYLSTYYGAQAPASGLSWTAVSTLPQDPSPGWGEYQFTAEGWAITIGYPVLPPEQTVYQVVAENQVADFYWEGEVDAAGQVTEATVPSTGLPVVAWYGNVVSLPAGSQFDDYLVVLPEGAAEIGLSGADAAIEAEIVALRDKEAPGKYAHFWGTLTCPILDYGGCELVVTRLRLDGPGPTFDPDPVEGWEGSISSGPEGLQVDDFFTLAGDWNVQYGIWSSDAAINGQLESLRDTGTVIRVWGELIAEIGRASYRERV